MIHVLQQELSFWITSLPLTSNRWFDQHIKAFHTLRSALSATSRMNYSSDIICQKNSSEKTLGNVQNRTWDCWVRSSNATYVCFADTPQEVSFV